MSSIDQYMPCVCGSGKKFKFCKCGANEHASDVEKILKLMDGDQELAALERVNGQLSKLPNAAWLYALKAEILLRLNEEQSFVEVARRFLKLKPDNPLALIFCSLATGFAGDPIQEQARYLLTGIAECRDNVPHVLRFAIELLSQRLMAQGDSAMLGFWGLMQRSSAGNNDSVLLQDPNVHWVCKAPNKILEVPADAPWQERMDEVDVLASAFRFEQVEKKLQSILREYPSQPAPLSSLLNAQIAQLDQPAAVATAKKLAEHKELTSDDRAIFQVLAWELEKTPLAIQDFVAYGEIDSDDRLIDELNSMTDILKEDDEELRYLIANVIDEEVPAKRAFRLRYARTVDGVEYHEDAGTVAIFGRQTDKPPRALLLVVNFPAFEQLRDQINSRLKLTRQLEAPVPQSRKYTDILGRSIAPVRGDRTWETIEEKGRRLVDEFLNLSFVVLNGKTPSEAASIPELHEKLCALVVHLEGTPSLLVPSSIFDEIYERLKLNRPRRLVQTQSDGNLVLHDMLDALWLDYDQLTPKLQVQFFNTLQSYGMFRMMLEIAQRLIEIPEVAKDQVFEYKLRSTLLSLSPSPDARLTHSLRLIELKKALKLPIGQSVLTHSSLLSAMGKEEDARAFLTKALRENQDDPELMMFAQQMYSRAAARQQGQDESLLTGGGDALGKQSASGLVPPGGERSTPTESKLWIPGT